MANDGKGDINCYQIAVDHQLKRKLNSNMGVGALLTVCISTSARTF